MSTRAIYTFIDGKEKFHVYKHHDGYPSGAAQAIRRALPYAWKLPRYEGDEMAAAFVAANKSWIATSLLEAYRAGDKKSAKSLEEDFAGGYSGGGVRLMQSGLIKKIAPCDIAYRYEIRQSGKSGDLHVDAYETSYWEDKRTEKKIFSGTLAAFETWALKSEESDAA